jgi:competence protein ComEA
MFSGFTKQEQRILILLVSLIALGLAIGKLKKRSAGEINLQSSVSSHVDLKNNPVGIVDKAVLKEKETGLVNINTATSEELCNLKGIGLIKAEEIIKYRNAKGKFKNIDDLLNVSGIGKKTLQKIRSEIMVIPVPEESQHDGQALPSVEDQGTGSILSIKQVKKEKDRISAPLSGDREIYVYINTDPLEKIITLEGIGEKKGLLIIDYRNKYGPFRYVEDILKVKGIGKKILNYNRDRIRMRNDKEKY